MAEFPAPAEGIVLTHFIVASDVDRTRRFYADVLGGEVLREGCRQSSGSRTAGSSSTWAAHPPDDKPTVTLETPRDPDHVSSFLNIRVADIHAVYERWRARGAEFLTPPTARRHELRCYLRDPDGHLIEIGQRIPG
jgi:catechol 2,3-dioxygenase-like lactoylglutathione lyase family enzyme